MTRGACSSQKRWRGKTVEIQAAERDWRHSYDASLAEGAVSHTRFLSSNNYLRSPLGFRHTRSLWNTNTGQSISSLFGIK